MAKTNLGWDHVDAWRGMGPGEARPPPNYDMARKFLLNKNVAPDARRDRDIRENGCPLFMLTEWKQRYGDEQFKLNHGPPNAYCRICQKEAWSPYHFYSNGHCTKVALFPYTWENGWAPVPDHEHG